MSKPAESIMAGAQCGAGANAPIRCILVADDSRTQRKILSSSLRRLGYDVIEAASGTEALAICTSDAVDLVISDWMMPGMNGPDFCRAFRALERDNYGYFILLTSKSGKGEIACGLDAGADDFLTKPVNSGELRARIQAGARVLKMERELIAKNRIVSEALGKIRKLYDALDRDLAAAKILQDSLVPKHFHDLGTAQVSLMVHSSGHVGGDLVGLYPIDERRVGIYSLDVSGHGVGAAMMTARLAGLLSGAAPEQNVALRRLKDGGFAARRPDEVAERLNRQMLAEIDTDHYFTLLLAEMNLATGHIVMVQAGHPHPAVQRADGRIEFLGNGGLPVGLIADARFETFTARLAPGDRLLVYSDGLTECPAGEGAMVEEAGLEHLLQRHRDLTGRELLNTLVWELHMIAGTEDLPDDVSALLLEYDGAGGRAS